MFRLGFLSNPLLLIAVGIEIALLLLIVYTPPGNAAFGTAPLPAQAWLLVAVLAAVFGALEEIRKHGVSRVRERKRA